MTATQPLAILRELREAAGLSQADAARRVGLTGRQSRLTLGAWENGTYPADEKRRRTALIDYLWDVLRLRRDPVRFAEVWEVLEEAWGWEPLSDSEWRRLNQPPPAPITVAPPPFQAPASIAHFVGRVAELDELARRLQQPACRVALVGMGGVGKTSLAIEAAHRLRPHFPDGVLWAGAATSDPLDILQSWATVFGRDYSGLRDVASRAAAVRSLLAGKKVLLVLDDVRVAEQVESLLPGDQDNLLLLTTRNEEVGMALHATLLPLFEWSQPESRQLLVAILGEARVQHDPAAADELCSLVHHLPLAVEIAAQFLAVRKRQRLADMVRRLQGAQNRLDLRVSSRDVRTSFAVSWEALDAGHRHLFAALAVFEGRSFAVEAAAAVADLDQATTQERLENLKALSLVAEAEGERYRQHPLLADFAAEQLGARWAVTYERIANFYVTWVARWQGEQALVSREWDNLMAALQASYTLQLWSTLAALVLALTPLWFAQARYRAARQGIAYGYEAATQLQDHSLALFCLYHWGRACVEQDDYGEARQHLLAGLALAQQLQDHNGIANAQYWLATIDVEQTLLDEAETRLAIARHHFDRAGDRVGMALVLYQQAQIFYDRGRLDDAAACCSQALTIGAPAHSTTTSQILRLLADIAIEREQYDQARHDSQQALEIARSIQNRDEEAGALYSLAVIARHRGQHKEAMAYAQQAREVFAQTGNQGFEALTLYEVSKVQRLQGDLATAEAVCRQSLSILRQLQHQFSLVYVLHHLGELCQLSGRPNEAKCYFQEALTLALAQDHPMIADLRQCLLRHPKNASIATAINAPQP